jgi:polyprenyl-phospho-N-acetylgalactosaminyl synthase
MEPSGPQNALAILVPCYGDAQRIGPVLANLARTFAEYDVRVYVVDDGSLPVLSLGDVKTSPTFRVRLLGHVVNLGQGAALETARRAAIEDGERQASSPVVLTIDADGQHSEHDALKLVRAVAAGAEVALGNRFTGGSNVPWMRAILLAGARVFEWMLTGRMFGDAHNGLRAMSFSVAQRLHIEHARMAHATGIMVSLCQMQPPLRFVELPVKVTYTAGTLAKGQRAAGAFAILGDLLSASLFRPARK